MIGLSARRFLKKVYWNVIIVTVIAGIVPFLLKVRMEESFLNSMSLCLFSVMAAILVIYLIGCDRDERVFIGSKLKSIVKNRI